MTIDTIMRRLVACTLLMFAVAPMAGCGALDVSDPTAIEDEELSDAAAAELLRKDALGQFYLTYSNGAYESGFMSDEFLSNPPSWWALYGVTNPYNLLDRRESEQLEGWLAQVSGATYTLWHQARTAADLALMKFRRYGVTEARVAEMLVVRGFVTLKLAEDYCPGFPLHDVVDYVATHTAPLSTTEAFEHALADFDSALVSADDSIRILNLTRVLRGRALLNLGRFAEAAGAVAEVPTEFRENSRHTSEPNSRQQNELGRFAAYRDGDGIGNGDGGVGLDFVAAADPRIPLDPFIAEDGVTTLYAPGIYPDMNAPIVLASGLEARLIEAEAALHAGGDWRGILNTLREGVPGLTQLGDPGTEEARVDLIFRERAFWLFATGHRLADLRRLVSQYGRASEAVFPTGQHPLGGTYGTATSIPFPASLESPYVPAVTSCTSR